MSCRLYHERVCPENVVSLLYAVDSGKAGDRLCVRVWPSLLSVEGETEAQRSLGGRRRAYPIPRKYNSSLTTSPPGIYPWQPGPQRVHGAPV